MKGAHEIVAVVAAERRVLLLGGIAVIAHGLSRSTQDVDIWLDPLDSVESWASVLGKLVETEGLSAARATQTPGIFSSIATHELGRAVSEDRFIRILGAATPIDVFRKPRNFDVSDFDDVWSRARPLNDGTRLLDEIDLLLTKTYTERPHDESDGQFLEQKIAAVYQKRLRECSIEEARHLLERFANPDIVAFAAVEAKDRRVRTLAKDALSQMASDGDPYASELLARLYAGESD